MPRERPTVLVVEDDPATCNGISELLDLEGYRVVFASTVRDARVMLAVARPLAVIVDVVLRDGGSAEPLIEEMARDAVPFVVTSGLRSNAVIAQRYGAPFLPKPFDVDEFLTAVRAQTVTTATATRIH
jgi:DNA-binding response OmpR family regulator